MKIDRRVRYTKMVLKNSFVQLLNEKSFDKITVKELCERADVNRGTFYVHYKDQQDLLHQIQKDFLCQAKQLLFSCSNSIEYYEYIKENKDLINCLYHHHLSMDFGVEFSGFVREYLGMELNPMGIEDKGENSVLYDFLEGALIGAIMAWIKNDCALDATQLSKNLKKLYDGTLVNYLKK